MEPYPIDIIRSGEGGDGESAADVGIAMGTGNLRTLVELLRACDDARDELANHRANAPRESIQDRVRYDLTVSRLSSSLMRKERAYKEALIKHGERDAPKERQEQDGCKREHRRADQVGKAQGSGSRDCL